MKMLTKEIERRIPKLYSREHDTDPLAVAKFFDPTGGGTWYVIEGEQQGEDWLFFGYVAGIMPGGDELGYFRLSELQHAKEGLPDFRRMLPIERDRYFEPMKLSAIKAKHDAR